MAERAPTPLLIDTFDLNCDLTIRPRRLADQMKDKMDRTIGCGDLATVEKVIREGRTRWGGHTDLQIELTSLRIYEAVLRAEQGQEVPSPAMRTAVIGAGYMGARIAAEMLRVGHEVFVYDIAGARTAEAAVEAALDDAVRAGIMGSPPQAAASKLAALGRLTATASIGDAVSDARLVVEAVADNLSVKGLVYPEIVASCRTDAVFGSATMNLPLDVVQELLPETWRPRLIGLRFLAPILAVSLVEVTHVNLESRAPVKEVLDMMIAVGKTVVAGPTSTSHFSLVPFRLGVSDPFFSLLMVDVRGADADRPQPYIGPGYETVTDLMSVGIGEDDLEVCNPSRSDHTMIVHGVIQSGVCSTLVCGRKRGRRWCSRSPRRRRSRSSSIERLTAS